MVYGKDNRSISGVGGEWGEMVQGGPIWGAIRWRGHNLTGKTRKSFGGGFRGLKGHWEGRETEGKDCRRIEVKMFRIIFVFV